MPISRGACFFLPPPAGWIGRWARGGNFYERKCSQPSPEILGKDYYNAYQACTQMAWVHEPGAHVDYSLAFFAAMLTLFVLYTIFNVPLILKVYSILRIVESSPLCNTRFCSPQSVYSS